MARLVVGGERWLVFLMLFTLLFRFDPKPRVFRRLLIDSIWRSGYKGRRGGGEVRREAGRQAQQCTRRGDEET